MSVAHAFGCAHSIVRLHADGFEAMNLWPRAAGGATEKRKKYEMYMEGTLLHNIKEGIFQATGYLDEVRTSNCMRA